jgi:hypothetical protein
MWGELGTANSPDDDAATVKWYQDNHLPGYDRAAAEARLAAYESFLDKYQFRSAFSNAENLFQRIGERHYFAASHIIENARIADANDYIALTGWESTTIDNNSGLVDALRHLKGDPSLMRQANAPELLVIRPRHYVVARGATAVADAFIANAGNLHGDYLLHFSASPADINDRPYLENSYPVKLKGGEIFGQLLKDDISFAIPVAGPVTLRVWLTEPAGGKMVLERTEPMWAVDFNPVPLTNAIAVADPEGKWAEALQKQFGVSPTSLDSAAGRVDTILLNCNGPRERWSGSLSNVLARVREGSRLVLVSTNVPNLGHVAEFFAGQNLLTYSGTVGFDDTPWIGHWYFGRKHWLLAGLPSDCVWDWQYQAAAGGDGLILDAPGLEAVVGYGRNPGPNLGLGAAVVPVGQGQVVFLAIPGLAKAFTDGDAHGFNPVTAKRLIYNALGGGRN